MPGRLFTDYFLTDGIKATPQWAASADAAAAFRDAVRPRYDDLAAAHNPNEVTTEDDLIRPVLHALGWTERLRQQGTAGNEDIPDYLLFRDAEFRMRAARASARNRLGDALVVEESKRFGRPLDERDADDRVKAGSPHGQILRYLSTADSLGGPRWGFLTNGSVWRLYDYGARPRATAYCEADLARILQPGAEDDLRVFLLLFRRNSFIPRDGATSTFLEDALEEGRRYEQRVAQDLSKVVFETVFPQLVTALADAGGDDLPAVRHAALIFLYRLLFLLYAEDRDLLPVHDSRYDDYGLRTGVRDDIARRMRDKDAFSTVATNYYDHVMTLCRIIDRGDPSIGIPPYNGGLFAADAAPLLNEVRLPDADLAPIIHALSSSEAPSGEARFVNYRDMSVQQLGSIYERLLEREPVRGDDGGIVVRPNPYARKDSGSFFTPQELVDLIVERTLGPLIEERLKAFEDTAAQLKSDRRPKAKRLADLRALDPAEAVLGLKVLDPAMGSGHFLVTAVDFLSDYIAELVEYVPAVPDWLGEPYESPVVARIAAIRADIDRRATESKWVLDRTKLSDQAIIRRMVLKRCIYGIDKNPLTVELAKVSLWLHSFTVGAPLSFLDHHLRAGDSLLGLRVTEATTELNRLAGLSLSSATAGAEAATDVMHEIEEMSDADIGEVRESAALFHDVEETTADLRGLLNLLGGMRWLTAGMKVKERAAFWAPLLGVLDARPADAYHLLAHGPDDAAPPDFADRWREARAIADDEGFLHWEAAFPGVWTGWQDAHPSGGFDAVIGNPPWDRIKLQEVEWFATRDPGLAHAPTAAQRRAGIERLREAGSPLADDFDAAKGRADTLGRMVRESGHYPLLGGGDINLYSLFVERAMALVKPDGFVGLLTPSGIYADKTAARFFQSVSTTGRVAAIFDFENRKIFFKDVHASFKFCALIFGGAGRRFDETTCAFFLHGVDAIKDADRCFPLAPADFARVNPNTGTAPVFRTRRDADITRRIYEDHPVLVDRSSGEERRVWPVRYHTMLHMANDSALFRTAWQLDADGFYPVQGNRWRRGEDLYLPLYQGRMIRQFDHRAGSVRVNPDSTHNPYLTEEVTEAQHADPQFRPSVQYSVPEAAIDRLMSKTLGWTIAYRRIARSTDVRTMISSVAPKAGFGDSVFLLMPDAGLSAADASSVVANLNSFAFDFVTRQKMHGTNLSWYLLEQLPVIAPADYDRRFGDTTARDLVRDHVLRLTYTAHDMAPFARDLGYEGPPFIWNDDGRRHLRARLDALYFHLYGLSRDDAGYVLSTFPIVRKEDEKRFGAYRTRDLILAYMNALGAGDTETVVDL